ncbi:MAG: N-acetyl-gamma-glutamyl-phosphate reductase [Maricaulaceae bacterium]
MSHRIAVLGASGYTGSEAVRLFLNHPQAKIVALSAHARAGAAIGTVHPHLAWFGLPDLVAWDQIDWSGVDIAVSCLPHGASADIVRQLPERVRIIDLSADFRLRNPETYVAWYGRAHGAPALLADAVYGLTEFAGPALTTARVAACPGCYPTATLLALKPLAEAGLITGEDLIIDAKSGVSGAGRALKDHLLFTEAGEGVSAYGVGHHRHMPEIEQELSLGFGAPVTVSFTPHLIPMSRGELITAYVRLTSGTTWEDLRAGLEARFAAAPFVHVLEPGRAPSTRHVRGSNHAALAVFPDRRAGRAIVLAAIDNLVKGSSGQAVQNFNRMIDAPETTGLTAPPLSP